MLIATGNTMKRVTILLAFLLIAASASLAQGQESAADWVKKLSSGSYPEREKAGRMLEKIGKAALPALRDAADHADLETRRRAVIVMERIEDRLVFDQVLAATPIHLQFKNVPASDALREVGEQTGLRLGLVPGKERSLSVEGGPLPYWQAWRRLRTAAKLEESDYAVSAANLKPMDDAGIEQLLKMLSRHDFEIRPKFTTPRIEFASKPTGDAYAEDDRTSVRVRVKWRSLDKSVDAKQQHAIFAVEVRPEARLEIAALPRVEITKIVDADGQEKIVQAAAMFPPLSAGEAQAFLAAYVGEIQFGGLLHLKAIPWSGPARPLKELHGRVRLEAVSRATLLEVPGVLKASGKEAGGVGGVTLKVLEADTSEEGQLMLRLRLDHLESLTPQTDAEKIVRLPTGVIAVRGPMDVALDRLELRDAKGWPYRPAKTGYEQVEKGCYEASVYFAVPPGRPEEISLALTKAAKTVTVDMPFQVRDVAAPVLEGK
jgi:hypothetical protein